MNASKIFVPTLAVALGLTGCFKLDPFIYEPERKEAYVLDPEGKYPEETVRKDQIELVSIKVDDEVTLGGAYVKASVQPPRAYVIFFHGKGGNVDTALPRTKRWANLGFDVLVFDYRGWGTSTNVTPSEAGIEQDTRAARAFMLARIGSPDRLIYYGQSLGTATATQRAELDPPKVLVLESGFASVEEFKRDSTQMDFPQSFISKDGWNTSTRIKNVHAPLLLMHGLADDFVRPEFSQLLFDNANDPKKLVMVEGADHGNIPVVMGAKYGETIKEFIAPHVPAAP
jgi:uncharacterized protein